MSENQLKEQIKQARNLLKDLMKKGVKPVENSNWMSFAVEVRMEASRAIEIA